VFNFPASDTNIDSSTATAKRSENLPMYNLERVASDPSVARNLTQRLAMPDLMQTTR